MSALIESIGPDRMSRIQGLLGLLNERMAAIGGPSSYDRGLLTERAEITGLSYAGVESCNRSCRLLATLDGWIALNLARPCDWDALPALFHRHERFDSWEEVASAVRAATTLPLASMGRQLEVPIAAAVRLAHARAPQPRSAPAQPMPAREPPACGGGLARGRHRKRRRDGRGDWRGDPPLVVDLSTLWAGPLCGRLMRAAGARVIKVESIRRPDSLSSSAPEFFARLNGDKECVAFDLTREAGIHHLRTLLGSADLVITSARPRAFAQMGLEPGPLLEKHPGLVWLAITAYGWRGELANAVGFGDDVAAAAGLLSWSDGGPTFVADAIADPLTGITAAIAAIDAIETARGGLMDVNLYAGASRIA